MTDRIKEPWGGRTPFGPGEEWSVRVDQFLEEGISEVDRWIQTASILHFNGDALDIAVKAGCGPAPPASLGCLQEPSEMLVLAAGVVLLTVVGWTVNRVFGVPVWLAGVERGS